MLPITVGIAITVAVLLAVALKWYLVDRPSHSQRRASHRLRELMRDDELDTESAPKEPAERDGVWKMVSKIGAKLAPATGRHSAKLRAKLALAGYTRPVATRNYLGLQLIAAVAGATVASALAAAWPLTGPKILLFVFGGAAAGFVGVAQGLQSQIAKRNRAIAQAFPDALDILVLAVEGGASMNAALTWMTEEIQPVHPILGAEMVIVEGEIQLGLSPADAIRGLAARCNNPDIHEFAAAMLQSERYGAGVAKVLRGFADAARQDRQLRAEEGAQKAAVKIVFPMLLFIFPAIFIVLLGPAAMQMTKLFTK